MPGTETNTSADYGFGNDYAGYEANVAANDAKKKPANMK